MKLTTEGQNLVKEFVRAHARGNQNLDAWYTEAEELAMNMRPGETGVVIEVRAINSFDRTTHDLTIPRAMFAE